MKKNIAIYLAGSIQKDHEKADETFWTADDMSEIKQHLPEFNISF